MNLLKSKSTKENKKIPNQTLISNELYSKIFQLIILNLFIENDKGSTRVLNTSVPYMNRLEKQTINTSSINKSSQGKNSFIQQNLIDQIQPISTKNFLHSSKILDPKKNEFFKQHLTNTLSLRSQNKPNLIFESSLIIINKS